MANSFQVRASVNVWLRDRLPLDDNDITDTVAFQMVEASRATEWRVWWDSERPNRTDQGWRRLVQIDRNRSDGDEMALEADWVEAMTLLGLAQPGRKAQVPIYDYPDHPATQIGTATVSRFDLKGWRHLADPEGRSERLHSTTTLAVDYPA